jgi:predicted acetylornithine/succinylornithine family transaminase
LILEKMNGLNKIEYAEGISNDIVEWMQLADKVIATTYTRFPLMLVQGEGSRVWDSTGKEYLDFVSGLAACNLGHCHPTVTKAVQDQAGKLIHVSNLYHIQPQIELARLLVEYSFADRAFFCNSGAEANEAAIKLVRKAQKDKGAVERVEIITCKNSFHGRTLATITATGQEKFQKGFEPLVPGFRYVPFDDLQALENAVSEKTAAVMLEPIQGEGGVNVPGEGYLKKVRELCNKRELFLIFDEVQTGMGRTGDLFAYQHENAVPDIMTLAKSLAGGIPIGAMLASETAAKSFSPGTHASTFGGNPLATRAGVATLQTIIEEKLPERAAKLGKVFMDELKNLSYSFIRQVRGRGFLMGMELDIPGKEIVSACIEKGLLINCTMDRVLRFLPPLIISETDLEQGLKIFKTVLEQI